MPSVDANFTTPIRAGSYVGTPLSDVSTGSALSSSTGSWYASDASLIVYFADGLSARQFVGLTVPVSTFTSLMLGYFGDPDSWAFFAPHHGAGGLIGEATLNTGSSTCQHQISRQTEAISSTPIRKNVISLDAETHKIFGRFAHEWRHTRNKYDSGVQMFTHPAYQKIIGMGEKILPLIIEELSRELDHWFWALKAISREDPVPAEEVGNLELMRARWLDWAERRGYSWPQKFTSTHYERSLG